MSDASATTLIACSHGTRFADGRAVVSALVAEVVRLLPGTRVLPAFVDVEEPAVADVVADVPVDQRAIIVPLLLSRGFHTSVDIARAAAPYPHVRAALPLGPHPLLADVLISRLAELEGEPLRGTHVVLAASGSANPVAVTDVEALAETVRERLPWPLTVGYAAGVTPHIADAVAAARAAGAERVIAASYVLAPGHFASLVAASGADAVSAPLALTPDGRAEPRVARVIVDRFHEAMRAAS
ncbi:CbiX/SirB N-terminal domain-containing protein [Microbacterium sp.]|uniref:sirohydrochlorin chelatase n=1 Tax=Microbacterium sp. TaxID=51671 RepID=UPI0025FBEB8F|nr:CbiX/SirB N-terminal domain-containing protein [Microbacterium sp.]